MQRPKLLPVWEQGHKFLLHRIRGSSAQIPVAEIFSHTMVHVFEKLRDESSSLLTTHLFAVQVDLSIMSVIEIFLSESITE